MSKQPEQFGKYILLEQLAQGGMAQIYLAKSPGAGGINKFVAIKRILPQFSDNEEFIRMFKDEAKIVVNLSHSNIVSVNEFGVFEEQFYLAMDYVPGKNLRQILNKMKKKDQQFSIEEVVYIGNLVAAGLDHAHRCLDGSTGKPLNITHRDMSPQNIMISYEGEVKIVDFGIAKAESQIETTRAGTLKGKFGYMSPEQAEGQAVDLRTDVFSLGIVLWEMLANERLFIANNEINTLRKIRDCQVPSLKKFNPNIHPELERIILKALARDRNMRYHTASGLHRDLNRFLNRQYPDFSPQDFAVHIKTLFADEILKSRKKMMSWAKLPSPEVKAPEPAPMPEIQRQPEPEFPRESSPSDMDEPKTVVTDGSFSHNLDDETGGIDQNKTVISAGHPHIDNNLGPSDALNLDEINKGLNNKDSRGFLRENGEITMADTHIERNLPAERKTRRKDQGSKKVDMGQMIPIALVVVLLIVGGFLLLSPEEGSRPVGSIEPTGPSDQAMPMNPPQPVAQPLPVEPQPMGNNQQPVAVANPNPTQPTFNPPPQQASPAPKVSEGGKAIIKDNLVSDTCEKMDPSNPSYDVFCKTKGYQGETDRLAIQSFPSGAKILLNGENTGKTTPADIDVPRDNPFTITLERRDYITYEKKNIRLAEVTGQKLNFVLQQAMVAYITIDVLPPSKYTKVKVNGVPLKENRLPISNYAIPANQTVVVEAYNTFTRKVAKKTIKLQNRDKAYVEIKLPAKRKGSRSRQ